MLELMSSLGQSFLSPEARGYDDEHRFSPWRYVAVGWILLQILSGYKAKWIQDSHSKVMLFNSSPQEFWTTHLHLAGPPSTDPKVFSAIDLARGLLRADPAKRLTCPAALAHQFLRSLA